MKKLFVLAACSLAVLASSAHAEEGVGFYFASSAAVLGTLTKTADGKTIFQICGTSPAYIADCSKSGSPVYTYSADDLAIVISYVRENQVGQWENELHKVQKSKEAAIQKKSSLEQQRAAALQPIQKDIDQTNNRLKDPNISPEEKTRLEGLLKSLQQRYAATSAGFNNQITATLGEIGSLDQQIAEYQKKITEKTVEFEKVKNVPSALAAGKALYLPTETSESVSDFFRILLVDYHDILRPAKMNPGSNREGLRKEPIGIEWYDVFNLDAQRRQIVFIEVDLNNVTDYNGRGRFDQLACNLDKELKIETQKQRFQQKPVFTFNRYDSATKNTFGVMLYAVDPASFPGENKLNLRIDIPFYGAPGFSPCRSDYSTDQLRFGYYRVL